MLSDMIINTFLLLIEAWKKYSESAKYTSSVPVKLENNLDYSGCVNRE